MENKIIVAFRVDASIQIGSGHIMRCLTLAEQLKNDGAQVVFICCDMPGNMAKFIREKGYLVYTFPFLEEKQFEWWKYDLEQTQKILKECPTPVAWLIIDHYSLDAKWEMPLRCYTKRIMVIDDLANRFHHCDVLLDQNLYLDMDCRYVGLVPERCKMLLGPQYVLLRPEFYEARNSLRERDGKIGRILIFFGGSDPTNETKKTLAAVKMLNQPNVNLDVVVGIANPNKDEIRQLCDELSNVTFYCQIENMAELMVKADLAIGAGGTTTWERCFLGLPTITVIVADNQIKVTEAVARRGAIWNLGNSDNCSSKKIFEFIKRLMNHPQELLFVSKKAMQLMKKENFTNVSDLIFDLYK